jgi:hypothetical protein
MAAFNPFVSALDMTTSGLSMNKYALYLGENGHAELDWSTDMKEKVAQFDFQCVRTEPELLDSVAVVLHDLLKELSVPHIDPGYEITRREALTLLYKIIGKTRDIEGGKGEYALSYMMVWTWYTYFPELAKEALTLFVMSPQEPEQPPYGSWKDIKYFCEYIRVRGATPDHELIRYCIQMTNRQLRKDMELYQDDVFTTKRMSLVAKWIPRESSKFGWLYAHLAYDYFPEFLVSVNLTDKTQKERAEKKCKAQYRILCATLNRHLDTVQIKQTAKCWADIDHAKTTSITMAKNRLAFLNLTDRNGNSKGNKSQQRSREEDRIQCAANLKTYLESIKREGREVKGKHVGLHTFTEQATNLLRNGTQTEIDILNSQWRDNGDIKNAAGLGPMVAMVDTSGSMDGDPMNAAIALGCRVAEKSILGRRVLTFSAEPQWISLDGCDTFTSMVGKINEYSKTMGLNTDFYRALDMILSAVEDHTVPPDVVETMVLAIFSDMQIDDNLNVMNGKPYGPSDIEKIAARKNWDTMFQNIRSKYADVGMRMYGIPLNPPHILFWNLRKTDGFPTLSREANCSMMSGFDPTLLNMFCELGMDALKNITPTQLLIKSVDNPRYDVMTTMIRSRLFE